MSNGNVPNPGLNNLELNSVKITLGLAGAPSRRSLALNVETWYVRNEVSANRARPKIKIFLRPIQPESGPR